MVTEWQALGCVYIDRVVLMFDEQGQRKDKFSTKPADKGPKNYVVREMAFSPQSDKLAIAQSDNMVFVYKLGESWGTRRVFAISFSIRAVSLAWYGL